MRFGDTAAEAEAVQVAVYRALSPVKRLEIALAMSDEVLALTVAGVRARRPDLDAEGVAAELHHILGHPNLVR